MYSTIAHALCRAPCVYMCCARASTHRFTVACRRLRLVSAADTELAVNVVFSLFDIDAAGDIDVGEFVQGIAAIKSRAAAADDLRHEFNVEVHRLRGRVAMCERALAVTIAFEDARRELREILDRPSIERRVAQRIKKCRMITPASLWDALDRTSNGRLQLRPQGDGTHDQILRQVLRKVPRLLWHREVVDGLRAIVPEAAEAELAGMVEAIAAKSEAQWRVHRASRSAALWSWRPSSASCGGWRSQ